MYKKIIIFVIALFLSGSFISHANAQMMGNYGNPSVTVNPTDMQQQQQDEVAGKKQFDQLQNKQITCQKLTNTDFEKIGEYVMSQRFNDTQTHVQVNNNIKSMMGENGEENMHIRLGIAATGCNTNLSGQGGGNPMMGWGNYGYGYGNMMNGNFGWGFATFHFLIALVVLVDLILAGIWLWQQISSHKRK